MLREVLTTQSKSFINIRSKPHYWIMSFLMQGPWFWFGFV